MTRFYLYVLVTGVAIAVGLSAVGCSEVGLKSNTKVESTLPDSPAGQPSAWVSVRYFYHTLRCPACEVIEILARKTVEHDFAEEFAASRIKWDTVNMDLPENRLYQDRYGLQAPSVVVSEFRGDEEIRWKNLESVWELYENEIEFRRYVHDEVEAFLKSLPQ